MGANKDSVVRQQTKFFGMKKKEAGLTFDRAPPFPRPLSYLWAWFREIRPGVQGNGYSYPVITWTELDAWASRTRQDPEPREARAIIILGTMHANILSEKLKADAAKG